MNDSQSFSSIIKTGYVARGAAFQLGSAMRDGDVFADLPITIPLKTANRHGLVAGATGTGKTRALQYMAESFSSVGVPVLMMDMKGDLAGIAQPGISNQVIQDREKKTGITWVAEGFPVEFLTISADDCVKMRATVSEFGPILFSKVLELNETQQSVMALLFKFADDHQLPIVDLKDMKKLIVFLTNEGKSLLASEYGSISTSTTGIILRKIIELEGQGAQSFFGEPSFDVRDLMHTDTNRKGMINIFRILDIQDQPKLFSSFMLSLVTEIYRVLPEVGDVVQPKLVVMIDEAHLLFREATDTLLKELEMIIKLIRSKGVSVIFCTQLPTDIPPVILSQLGLKVQFALRAFTANDRKAIKLISENYPESVFYKVNELITQLGIGEALVTALDERGNPTPLVQTMIASPHSRMGTLTDNEFTGVVGSSTLRDKYETTVDSESAYEILTKKLSAAAGQTSTADEAPSSLLTSLGNLFGGKMGNSMVRTATTTVVRNVTGQIMRGVLGSILR